MSEKNLFEVAAKNKYRFSHKGLVSVEDLWDLHVTDLDEVFKGLNSKVRKVKEESLLGSRTQEDEELNNKIEIVRHIVGTKLLEEENRFREKEIREQRQKIMEVLSSKENKELENKTPEELRAILEELN